MLLERGIVVSHETIRCWAKKFGPDYAGRLRRKLPSAIDVLRLDEVVVTIGGKKHWLWRAIDQDGHVLDEIVQGRCNTKAARRLLLRLFKQQGFPQSGLSPTSFAPMERLVAKSCRQAGIDQIMASTITLKIRICLCENESGLCNGFRSLGGSQRFLPVFSAD